jgi:dipeptidyl aminopeptidase/acylaminoacyl peptidase
MTKKNSFRKLVGPSWIALVALASACGDLQSPNAPVRHVSYKTNGEIAAFLPRELVTLKGNLQEETARVAFDSPPSEGKTIILDKLSADGQVAVVGWSKSEAWREYPFSEPAVDVTIEAFRLPARDLLLKLDLPSVSALELSPAGNRIAVMVPLDAGLRIDVYALDGTGAMLWSSTEAGYPFVFSPDGEELYASTPLDPPADGLGAFSGVTGVARYKVPLDPGAYTLAVSPDGARLIAASTTAAPILGASEPFSHFSYLRISDGQAEQTVPQAPDFDVALVMAVSSDGEHWASIANDIQHSLAPSIQMWNTAGTLLYSLPTSWDMTLAFSPDGQQLVATPDPTSEGPGVNIYRVSDGELIVTRSFTSDTF